MDSIAEQETNYGSFALVAAGPAITIKALFTFFSDGEASHAGELSISQSFRKARRKYVKRYGRRFIRRFLNGFLAHQSLVPHAPIHDNRSYPFLERFVENWPIIHNEVRAILKHREAIRSSSKSRPINRASPEVQTGEPSFSSGSAKRLGGTATMRR